MNAHGSANAPRPRPVADLRLKPGDRVTIRGRVRQVEANQLLLDQARVVSPPHRR